MLLPRLALDLFEEKYGKQFNNIKELLEYQKSTKVIERENGGMSSTFRRYLPASFTSSISDVSPEEIEPSEISSSFNYKLYIIIPKSSVIIECTNSTENLRTTIGNPYELSRVYVEDDMLKVYIRNDLGLMAKYSLESFKLVIYDDTKELKCIVCNNYKYTNKIYNESNKTIYTCKNCINTNIKTCTECHKTNNPNSMRRVIINNTLNGKDYCEQCYKLLTEKTFKCKICKDKTLNSEARKISNFEPICNNCLASKRHRSYLDLPNSAEGQGDYSRYFEIGVNQTSSNTMDLRSFGVEFEVICKTDYLRPTLIKLLLELEEHKIGKYCLRDFIKIHNDGSINRDLGIELVTTILRGDMGEEVIKQLCKYFNKYFTTDASCGLHVHIGVQDFTDEELLHLYHLYLKVQPTFKYYVEPHRLTNTYCKLLKQVQTKTFKELLQNNKVTIENTTLKNNPKYYAVAKTRKMYNSHDCHYEGINFDSVTDHSTVEIRFMEGTLDADKIINWIKLHQKIVNYASINGEKTYDGVKLEYVFGDELFKDFLKKKKDYYLKNRDSVIDNEEVQ